MLKVSLHKGFTLIELLIAISLSSIVMVVLVGGFYMVSKNWDAQDKMLDTKIDDSLIRLEIEKAIFGSFPYTYLDKNKKNNIFFKGSSQQLSFISTMSPSYNNQLSLWHMQVKNNGGLYIQVAAALTGDPGEIIEQLSASNQKSNKPTLVFEDFNVKFEFFTEDKQGVTLWEDKWDAVEKKLLPQAVAIHLIPIDKKFEESHTITIVAIILANKHQTIKPLK